MGGGGEVFQVVQNLNKGDAGDTLLQGYGK